jgi:hypothetical protein
VTDETLRQYVRYLNCAEALRLVAEFKTDRLGRDALVQVATKYEQMAMSLNLVLRAKADLET